MEICKNRKIYKNCKKEKPKTTICSELLSLINKFHIPHIINCCIIIFGFILFDYYIGEGYLVFVQDTQDTHIEVPLINKLASYYRILLGILLLPLIIINFIGCLIYDVFQNEVKLRVNPATAPFICFRFATRGHYFEMIDNNVTILKDICLKLGITRFIIEVATENELPLSEGKYVKQTVIPKDYVPKSGALFKARVLQYCLEDEVNFLNDNDWIVHMDEETRASENSVKGILNFVCDGRYQLAQGMLIFLKENLLTNPIALLDGWRITDDLGKQRFQLKLLHRLILEWKGTFWVAQAGAEKTISFDHGLDSSIAEDGYFGFLATKLGYRFDFLEGEMYEMSPTTIYDVIQQRKRWLQGGLAICRSSEIPLKTKFMFCINIYSIMISFCGILPVILKFFFPIPYPTLSDLISSLLFYLIMCYQNLGVLISFTYFSKRNYISLFVAMIMGVLIIIPNALLTVCSAVLAFTSSRKCFYVVKKD